MATIGLTEAEPVKTLHDGPMTILNLLEGAGQAFGVGRFVTLVSGKVFLAGTAQHAYLGMTMSPAAGVVDTPVQVALATADTVFCANLTTGQATAVSDVGKSYGLVTVSSRWHVTKAVEGANARVLIVDLDRRDAVGDIQGRVHFIFLGKYRQFDVTS